jgi:hypothetical protein
MDLECNAIRGEVLLCGLMGRLEQPHKRNGAGVTNS